MVHSFPTRRSSDLDAHHVVPLLQRRRIDLADMGALFHQLFKVGDPLLRHRVADPVGIDLRTRQRQRGLEAALPGADPAPRPVGYCDQTPDTGDETWVCGRALFLPRAGRTVTCRGCDHTYDADAMIRLRQRAQRRNEP